MNKLDEAICTLKKARRRFKLLKWIFPVQLDVIVVWGSIALIILFLILSRF